MNGRTLREIAVEIDADWQRPYKPAIPYLNAMYELSSITDRYYLDSAEDIVLRFLSNAGSWKGETARRIKAELRELLADGQEKPKLAQFLTRPVAPQETPLTDVRVACKFLPSEPVRTSASLVDRMSPVEAGGIARLVETDEEDKIVIDKLCSRCNARLRMDKDVLCFRCRNRG